MSVLSIVRVAGFLAMACLLVACNTTTNSGRPMKVGEFSEIEPWESRFNTFLLVPDDQIYTIKRNSIDNGEQILELAESGRIKLFIQHTSIAWYGERFKKSIMDPADIQEELDGRGKGFDVTTFDNGGSLVGYTATNGRCNVAIFLKHTGSATIYDNDSGKPNTYVEFSACGPDRIDPAQFVEDFAQATEGDKAAIRTRFADARSATKITQLEAGPKTSSDAPRKPGQEVTPFDISWEDSKATVSGEFNRKTDVLSIHLPDGERCFADDTLSNSVQNKRWRVTCDSGVFATGYFTNSNVGHGLTGFGHDNQFKAVILKLGDL